MKKRIKIALIVLLAILLALIVIVGGYVAYLFASYSRLPDNLALEPVGQATDALDASQPHKIVTWNLGFGAYSADYSFFMDGGTESRARAKDAVYENIGGALKTLNRLDADLMLLQEIDIDATRSHHVDESALIREAMPDWESVFAQNYDSAYLFYPLSEPHGASKAGQMTLAKSDISSALRRSLPVETGIMKFFDLDRCYSVSEIPVSNGKTLHLINLHLSAYTSDGTISAEQFMILLSDMTLLAEQGDYVIAGGDFNKDLLGNSEEVFGVSGDDYTWAQPLPVSWIPDGLTLADSLDPANPIPSCRNADKPYAPGESFVLTVDGFIASDNIEIIDCAVEDEGFAFSDHNPVTMTFRFK